MSCNSSCGFSQSRTASAVACMASHRGTPSAPSRFRRAYGPLFADPQVDQPQFEQPFDGLFALQSADFPQQDRGQSFCGRRHASGVG